jgi:DNA-directed RNA polymerase subunit L
MPIFKVISHNSANDKLQFEITHSNNIPMYTCFVNTIRRTILSNITTVTVQRSSIVFDNTSMLNNDILSHRLILVPFHNYLIENLDDIELSLDISNDNDHMIDVLVSDMIMKNNGTVMNYEYLYPDILFAKLKPTQHLKFTARFHTGTTQSHGAEFSPVSCSTYEFKKDISAINRELRNRSITTQEEIKRFQISEADRYYLKDNNDNPLVYIFTIEPIGNISSKNIMLEVCDKLTNDLEIIKTAINTNDQNIIQIYPSTITADLIEYKLYYDETIANLIGEYLYNHTKTNFSSYYKAHPFDDEVYIRSSLTTKNTLDENKTVFIEVLDQLVDLLRQCRSDANKLF